MVRRLTKMHGILSVMKNSHGHEILNGVEHQGVVGATLSPVNDLDGDDE